MSSDSELNANMGLDRHSRQTPGSSNRITIAVVGVLALIIILGSIFFVQSTGKLPHGYEETGLLQNSPIFMLAAAGSVDDSQAYDSYSFLDDSKTSTKGDMEDVGGTCSKKAAVLKVFMYDLPPRFHFGMIPGTYKGDIWPENMSDVPRYSGGLNMQHSIEYWLTLDLLSSFTVERKHPCTAILVDNHRDADVYFVPFFSSLSYNKYTKPEHADGIDKNVQLQEELVQVLRRQNSWRRSGGKNHVIVMHHPNSLHVAREQLRSAMFIVSDFGRYSPEVANVWKDVVAPYKHMVPTFSNDDSNYSSRKTLLFFQGAIVRKGGGIIRQKLYQMLKDEPDIHFSTGSAQSSGIHSASQGMRSSKFCLHLAGDTPSSNRLFDAIVSHCVPVVISDDIELPYEDELDYSDFCLFVRSTDALQSGYLLAFLRSIDEQEWTRKWTRLKQLDHHFEYQYPTLPRDAVNMIWRSVARKLPSIKQSLNKAKRYSRSRLFTKTSSMNI